MCHHATHRWHRPIPRARKGNEKSQKNSKLHHHVRKRILLQSTTRMGDNASMLLLMMNLSPVWRSRSAYRTPVRGPSRALAWRTMRSLFRHSSQTEPLPALKNIISRTKSATAVAPCMTGCCPWPCSDTPPHNTMRVPRPYKQPHTPDHDIRTLPAEVGKTARLSQGGPHRPSPPHRVR